MWIKCKGFVGKNTKNFSPAPLYEGGDQRFKRQKGSGELTEQPLIAQLEKQRPREIMGKETRDNVFIFSLVIFQGNKGVSPQAFFCKGM